MIRTWSPVACALVLALGAAEVALAQADLAKVAISQLIERVNDQGTSFRGVIVIRGTEITEATVTVPGGPAQTLPPDGLGNWFIDLSFSSQAELDAAFPDGTYVFTLNGGAPINVVYVAPAVPSPAISAPEHNSLIAPESALFRFAPCEACTAVGDSTSVKLLSAGVVIESDRIDSSESAWEPEAVLEEDSHYGFEVVHVANRITPVQTQDQDFSLINFYSQADAVEFITGIRLTLVMDEPGLQIYDSTGRVTTEVDGTSLEYDIAVLPNGRISGTATLDRGGPSEQAAPLVGRLSGRNGRVNQKIRARFEKRASKNTKLRLLIREKLETGPSSREANVLRVGELTAKGKRSGSKVKERVEYAQPIADTLRGWTLDFRVAGLSRHDFQISEAVLILHATEVHDEMTIPLVGRGRTPDGEVESKLWLKSRIPDKGIRIEIRRLKLDTSGEIAQGKLRYKILGQRGIVFLP